MEEIIAIEEWLTNYKPPEITYRANYNPNTGSILRVGPSHAIEETNSIDLDKEIALKILDGEAPLAKCYVDLQSKSLQIAEIKYVYKIDDVLHRIIEKQWSKFSKPDVVITYNRKKKQISVELSEEFNGSYKLPDEMSVAKRNIVWDGDTNIEILLTDYNNPHILHGKYSVTINELCKNKKIFKNIKFPKNFISFYTRRLFKNYMVINENEDN